MASRRQQLPHGVVPRILAPAKPSAVRAVCPPTRQTRESEQCMLHAMRSYRGATRSYTCTAVVTCVQTREHSSDITVLEHPPCCGTQHSAKLFDRGVSRIVVHDILHVPIPYFVGQVFREGICCHFAFWYVDGLDFVTSAFTQYLDAPYEPC